MFYGPNGDVYTAVGYDAPEWGPVAVPLHPRSMEKLASSSYIPSKLLDFMENIRPREDGRYLLVNALGAGEYWGSNKNGDYFPEWSLRGDPIPDKVKDYLRLKGLPIPAEWGYSTFERYAYPFLHHNNSDPIYTIGERVCCAAYNDRMHRVELIIFLRRDKAKHVIDDIDAGRPIAFSMGAKLPFDVCSVCLNAARNRAQYCEHLKNMLNHVLTDGTKVFSYNYFPRFFDISVVIVPADRSAYSLKKVAEYIDSGAAKVIWAPGMDYTAVVPVIEPGPVMEKFAGVFDFLSSGGEKAATIEKEIPPEEPAKNLGPAPIDPELWAFIKNLVEKDVEESPEMPEEAIQTLQRSPIEQALSSLSSLGIMMKPDEADRVVGEREIPEGLDLPLPDPKLLMLLKGLVGSRSMFDPHFSIRIIRITKCAGRAPMTLVKRASAYEKYKRWLATGLDLEKLGELTAHPRVRLTLEPSVIENEMFGLGKLAGRLPFEKMALPFIVGIAEQK